MNIMAILGSSRRNGNSEILANKVLEGIEHHQIFLSDKEMKPIVDMRHSEEGFGYVEDDYEELFRKFLQQDVIFFVTPLYWFGMSGPMKIFFDRWSQYLRDERFDVKKEMANKKAYVIVTGSNPDPKVSALPLIQQFGYIFDYMNMEFVDYIIGKANKPDEIFTDPYALTKAELLNKQLKKELRIDE